jgi:hypothetical protein
MLYNGVALQREFIKNKGLEALLHLIRKGDIMYQ